MCILQSLNLDYLSAIIPTINSQVVVQPLPRFQLDSVGHGKVPPLKLSTRLLLLVFIFIFVIFVMLINKNGKTVIF